MFDLSVTELPCLYSITLGNTGYKYQVAVPSAAQCDLHCTWYRYRDPRGKIPRVLENARCHLGLAVSNPILRIYIAIWNPHDARIRTILRLHTSSQARKSFFRIRISGNGSSRLAGHNFHHSPPPLSGFGFTRFIRIRVAIRSGQRECRGDPPPFVVGCISGLVA